MRYLSVDIYNSKSVIPYKDKIILAPCDEGNWSDEDIENSLDPDKFIKLELIERQMRSGVPAYKNYKLVSDMNRHTMMDGDFVYSCDSRFRRMHEYPVPLHNRFEG